VLRTGQAPTAIGNLRSWEPLEFYEGDYWNTVRLLWTLTPEQIELRPDLWSVKLKQDPDRVPNDDYEFWLQSLKDRGLS
jgi:hypothetical protein